MRFFPSHRFGVLLLLASSYAGVQAAESATSVANSPAIELPKFVVTDSRELPAPESWRYAAAPGLEILSKASEAHTRQFARNFNRLSQVTEIVWPAILKEAPPAPAILILCAGGKEFDTFAPAKNAGAAGNMTSLLLHEQEKTAIVVDVIREKPNDRFLDSAAPLSTAAPDEDAVPGAGFMTENDPYREFYLQYFRLTIRRGAGNTPAWLEEGLVQLLASIDFSKDYIAVGRLRDGAGGQRPDEFNVQLARRPLLPLEQMFSQERPAGVSSGSYPAQCYAFVHLCLYGRKGHYRPALLKLIERTTIEPMSEKLFQECFGVSYEKMGTELRSYTSYTAHEYVEYRLGKAGAGLVDGPPLAIREATQAEIGRIKGDAYQLGGHDDRARTALLAPYLRNEYDPALLAALGLHERARQQDERARKFLEAATLAQVANPRAYLELARIRFAEAKAGGGGAPSLSPEQTGPILHLLMVGSRQRPGLPEIYELTAEVWAISARAPSAEELAVLYVGVKRFPRRVRLVYLTAALALRHGAADTARILIDHGLKLVGDSEVSQHFKALQAQLPK